MASYSHIATVAYEIMPFQANIRAAAVKSS
jgi:hypothetical protein